MHTTALKTLKTPIHSAIAGHWLVTVFDEPSSIPPAKGSQAKVTLLERNPVNSPAVVQSVIEQLDRHITEVLLVPSTQPNCWDIRWFHQGYELVLCGHGTLAAAAVMDAVAQVKNMQMVFLNGDHQLRCRVEKNRGYLLSEAMPRFKKNGSDYDFIKEAIKAQYEVGDNTSYLLIELAEVSRVKQFQPDFSHITRSTSRAIILMAVDGNNTVIFRYFAPQYGNNEDQATGSAALIIGQYIARFYPAKVANKEITLQQASSSGASMIIKMCHGRIMIGGSVRLERI